MKPVIKLKPGKEKSILNFHPWVFSGAIAGDFPNLEDGTWVDVFSASGDFLGTGHFHKGSIAVRILSFRKTNGDAAFWNSKINAAWAIRKSIGIGLGNATNAFRLIHGEGDGLPGLIVDIYNKHAVLQFHTVGMFRERQLIADALKKISDLNLVAVFDKSHDFKTGTQNSDSNIWLWSTESNPNPEIPILENGLKFLVNIETGQKTGFFLDQRENRSLLGKYANGRSVLNTFSYTGGFSVYALAEGAKLVHSVDSSEKAGALCKKNVSLNFENSPHEFIETDVFEYLKQMGPNFDLIVLDPPAFAKNVSSLKRACSGYQNLNRVAFEKIAKGGILFTFSCSQVIDSRLFRQVVFAAAAQAKRDVKVLHRLSQPHDHPVSLFHPEGEYLKGLVLYVS